MVLFFMVSLGLLLISAAARFVPQVSHGPDLAMMFAPTAGLLDVFAMIACVVPVRRTRSVHPSVTLRSE